MRPECSGVTSVQIPQCTRGFVPIPLSPLNSPDNCHRCLPVNHESGWLHVQSRGGVSRPTRMHLQFPSCQITQPCKRSHNRHRLPDNTIGSHPSENVSRTQRCQSVISFPLPLADLLDTGLTQLFFLPNFVQCRSSSVSSFCHLPSGGRKAVPSTIASRTAADNVTEINIRGIEPSSGFG